MEIQTLGSSGNCGSESSDDEEEKEWADHASGGGRSFKPRCKTIFFASAIPNTTVG
jgi:hypothetical protein